jgi:cell division protein FtsL
MNDLIINYIVVYGCLLLGLLIVITAIVVSVSDYLKLRKRRKLVAEKANQKREKNPWGN